MVSNRNALAQVRKLIKAGDIEAVKQGIELVRSLNDEELSSQLIEGVTFQKNRLVPNKNFLGDSKAATFVERRAVEPPHVASYRKREGATWSDLGTRILLLLRERFQISEPQAHQSPP